MIYKGKVDQTDSSLLLADVMRMLELRKLTSTLAALEGVAMRIRNRLGSEI